MASSPVERTELIIALLLMAMGITVAAVAPTCDKWKVERLGGIAVGGNCVSDELGAGPVTAHPAAQVLAAHPKTPS